MLVAAVLSVDAYPFLAFSDMTCHLQYTGIIFSGWIVLPDSKETVLGSSEQEVSPSTGKNTGKVLVLCIKCVPRAISSGVDISDIPACHLLRQMSSQ